MSGDTSAAGDEPGLFTLLYVSVLLTPDADVVTGICEQSRVNNAKDDITGLLVFDGQAFCQFVEGPEPSITRLRDRLEHDPRHVEMRVLQFGATPDGRRFPGWRLGYAFAADAAAIGRLEAARGGAALVEFGRLPVDEERPGALAP
jgi:Sensors of blue-light using FAD